jgi:tRNA (guanine-N7-)-methyltransferase
MNDSQYDRSVRSFVIRGGRTTAAQQRALTELWPRYGIDWSEQPLDLDALFGRHAPRVTEIGFGSGENLIGLATRHPERDYLGIEVHPPGVGRLLLSLAERQLTNVRVSRHDAVEVLARQIPRSSFDEVLILFPDPWHKKRHHKRRLIRQEFVETLAERLKPGGLLTLATDWRPYADQMVQVLNACAQLENLSAGGAFAPASSERAPTRFERRGTRLGHEVLELAYRRR